MSTRTRVYRPVVSDLPDDFGERIEEFRVASGLTVRSLARLLGVSPYRVREWRRGVVPASRHLYLLLMIAGRMGLRELLERAGDDLPAEVKRQIAVDGGDYGPPPGSPHALRAHERGHPSIAYEPHWTGGAPAFTSCTIRCRDLHGHAPSPSVVQMDALRSGSLTAIGVGDPPGRIIVLELENK